MRVFYASSRGIAVPVEVKVDKVDPDMVLALLQNILEEEGKYKLEYEEERGDWSVKVVELVFEEPMHRIIQYVILPLTISAKIYIYKDNGVEVVGEKNIDAPVVVRLYRDTVELAAEDEVRSRVEEVIKKYVRGELPLLDAVEKLVTILVNSNFGVELDFDDEKVEVRATW